jgi:hypothetical protein
MSNIGKYTATSNITEAEIVDKKLAAIFRYIRNTCTRLDDTSKLALLAHTNEALDDFQDLLDDMTPPNSEVSRG